jgi:chemotaxis response regulator CheB
MPVRVLVADDHQLMREGTAALLGADERLEVVGLALIALEKLRFRNRAEAAAFAARHLT